MNTKLNPTETIKANAEQIMAILQSYGVTMIAQLEVNSCIDNIIEAAGKAALESSCPMPNHACEIEGNFTFERIRVISPAEKNAVANIPAGTLIARA